MVSKPKHNEGDYLRAEQIMAFHELQSPTDDVTEEFAASLRLARKIYSRNIYIPAAAERLKFIFDCLLARTPLLVLARDARLQLQLEVYSKSGWVSRALARISDGSSTGLVLTALVASTLIWTVVALLVYSAVHRFNVGLATDIFFMNERALAVISSAAFIGGVISIATRLQEFSRVRDLDPFAMFWTAMLKPLIGVVLSFFILATLAGGVISFAFFPGSGLADLDAATLTDAALKTSMSCGCSDSCPVSASDSPGISSTAPKERSAARKAAMAMAAPTPTRATAAAS
jgi:hypothetical protein